ncbi:MAG: 30S ribosomal protein S6, partial [Malacoplasma sp.]|nr:30S ribosomal protein S6 [Malacoplasma sp.]
MPKYEIMLVVDGSVKETEAVSVVNDLKTILKDSRDFKLDKWGLKDLAYPIKKKTRGYYFI